MTRDPADVGSAARAHRQPTRSRAEQPPDCDSEEPTLFVVITTVKVRDGSIDDLADLFDRTNRELVAEHEDWQGAWFTANRQTSEITVIARWRDAAAYTRLRNSPEFEATMAQFARQFVGPPSVSVNELLVEM